MSKVNYIILTDSLVINFDGKTINLNKSDHRYKNVIKAIKEKRDKDIPGLLDNEKIFNIDELELKDGLLYFQGNALPDGLSNRVIDFQREGLPFENLIKFFEKLNKNPSFNSKQMLYKFLEHNGHPITENGNFIAYRGVTKDFRDNHTGKFDNSIGAVCEMPREEVDDNPNNTCSNGLHVAAYSYANGFSSVLVEVEVNPEDVVCVPTDYDGTKMRVCKFKVVNLCQGLRDEVLYNTEKKYELYDKVYIKRHMINDEEDDFYTNEELEIVEIDGDEFTLQDYHGSEIVVNRKDITDSSTEED